VVAMFMFSEPKRRAVARAPLSWHLNGAGRSLLAGPHGARKVDDRDTNGVAVFGPGAVIVADVVAEQLLQGEPGVARALADPAVGDDGPGSIDALLRVDLAQLFHRLERSVLR